MTDYELITAREMLAQSIFALGEVQASFIAIYLSMIFAYTTVAYVAGKQLSKLQIFIATFVYVVSSVYMAANIVFCAAGFVDYQERMAALVAGEEGVIETVTSMLWIESVLWPLLMVAPLVFMWHVRQER
jgi:hypothetical protein